MRSVQTKDFASFEGHSPIKPELLYAIAMVESSLNPVATRYEPRWKYFYKVEEYAKKAHITEETERVLQSMSWGLMQVMGSVIRELGYEDNLVTALLPIVNIGLGHKKLTQLWNKYGNINDVISAYNQGSPRKSLDGTYRNQRYVSKVLIELAKLNGVNEEQ
tara:strand:- start:2812 stop:3297 length:486 start_codon:yes stop_codon:yes gene_type:complete